ncbi:hypothetical protein VdG1_06643 [Verticillium dahliae VDG1]|nr:hypothetical protein VdG1_06643 [Verticillium dahliae VDG1]
MRPPTPNRTLLRTNLLDPSTICRRCTAQLRPVLRAPSHAPLLARRAVSTTPSSRLSASYFLPNNALERAAASAVKARTQSQSSRTSATVTNDSSSTTAATAKGSASTSRLDATQPPVNAELPHRRRQAARRAAAAAEAEADSGSSSSSSSAVLPAQDASSALTTVAASQPARSLRRILSACLSLSKPRLTVLVVLTAMVPYALFPVPSFLVWHLPVVLGLATLQKKGMWSRVWASLFGAPHDDDDDEEWDELDETPAPLLPPRKA